MKGRYPVLAAVTVLMLCVSGASAALVDNQEYASWSKQKPGATLTFETNVNFPGMTMTSEETHVLKSVAADKVVVEVTVKMNMGGFAQEQKRTRDIPAKIEETEQGLPPEMKGSIKKVGTATIKAAGQDYECEIWEFSGEAMGSSATGKVWKSSKVPGQTVQSETNITTPMGAGVSKMVLKSITPAP